jgi:DNA-binding CsgD family transcriptional regulator
LDWRGRGALKKGDTRVLRVANALAIEMMVQAMGRLRLVDQFAAGLSSVDNQPEFQAELANVVAEMGFDYYALANHVDLRALGSTPFLLHNYPDSWADFYLQEELGPIDPVRRTSHRTSRGFRWSQIDHHISLSSRDRSILAAGDAYGIGDGFTVPAHVPGEVSGSCSFVVLSGKALPDEMLWTAQLIGELALERANLLSGRGLTSSDIELTDRQIECVLWAARGKTDGEIAQIMEISKLTVEQHQKMARDRYGVGSRTSLAIRALFDGVISFSDIYRSRFGRRR